MLQHVDAVILTPGVVQAAPDHAVERIVGDQGEQRKASLQCIDRQCIELARMVEAVAQAGDTPG